MRHDAHDDELARGEVGVQPPQSGGGEAPRVALRARRRRDRPSTPRAAGRRGSRAIALANSLGVATVDQEAGRRRRRRALSSPPTALATTGIAARRGLEGDEAEALAAARHEHDVGGAVVRRQDVVRLRRHEPHLIVRGRARRRARGRGRSRRRPRRRSPRRRSSSSASGRPSAASARIATSGPLSGWIRPTNSSTGRRPAASSAARAPAWSPGAKNACSTPGRDDLDAALRIAVQAAELALLLDAADADRVGARDDLGLGPVAPDRLGVAALGLHPGERVERRDERDVEDVLEAVGDDAAEPVVGVHDVGAAVGREVLEHAVGELVEDVGERLLRQVVRPGLDVHDAVAGLDEHLGREPGAVGAGVGGALDAGLGERRHHLAHVHVHPAAVAGARAGASGDVWREITATRCTTCETLLRRSAFR